MAIDEVFKRFDQSAEKSETRAFDELARALTPYVDGSTIDAARKKFDEGLVTSDQCEPGRLSELLSKALKGYCDDAAAPEDLAQAMEVAGQEGS